MKNEALIFIKPGAMTEPFIDFAKNFFAEHGVTLTSAHRFDAAELKEHNLVDRHYAGISRAALVCPPTALAIGADAKLAFYDAFDISWDRAIEDGKVFNAAEAMSTQGFDNPEGLLDAWKNAAFQVKLTPGIYAGAIADKIVLNGFYPAMRQQYLKAGSTVLVFEAQFEPSQLTWKSFRSEVLGATDPATATAGSLRRIAFEQWKAFEFGFQPTMARNAVHASAGPLDGLRERAIWMGINPAETQLGKAIMSCGKTAEGLNLLLDNAPIAYKGDMVPVCTATEGMDCDKAADIVVSSFAKSQLS